MGRARQHDLDDVPGLNPGFPERRSGLSGLGFDLGQSAAAFPVVLVGVGIDEPVTVSLGLKLGPRR